MWCGNPRKIAFLKLLTTIRKYLRIPLQSVGPSNYVLEYTLYSSENNSQALPDIRVLRILSIVNTVKQCCYNYLKWEKIYTYIVKLKTVTIGQHFKDHIIYIISINIKCHQYELFKQIHLSVLGFFNSQFFIHLIFAN